MEGILARVLAGGRVLDIGCRNGSVDADAFPFRTVRVDLDRASGITVQADAARLPFATGSFDAVVSNHSLEHFADLDGALAEIGRVLKHDGGLFVAVPDASTFTDRIYRWLARGGGHVNPFTSADDLAARIARATGATHRGTVVLHTSLSFLNRRNRTERAPRRMALLCGGWEPFLAALSLMLRISDRLLGTRLSVYGWALHFGAPPESFAAWTNVCVRCGSGHPPSTLRRSLLRRYCCPLCGGPNWFTPDHV